MKTSTELPPAPKLSVGRSDRRATVAGVALIVLTTLLFAAIGVGLGLAKTPTHKAQAQMNVGRLDVTAQALAGYADASKQLSATYARLVSSDAVVVPTAKALGVPAERLRGHLSGRPVAQSSVFYIEATEPNAQDAQRVANTAARQMAAFISKQDPSGGQAGRLLARYRSLSRRLADLQSSLGKLGGQIKNAPTPAKRARFRQLRLRRDELQLQLKGVSSSYTEGQFSAASGQSLQFVRRADSATSDQRDNALKYGGAGAVAGLLLGVALFTLRRRRVAAPPAPTQPGAA
jgi:hypothetical protein